MRSDFPTFKLINKSRANPRFVKLICSALKNIDFDSDEFSRQGRLFFKEIKSRGTKAVLSDLEEVDEQLYGGAPHAKRTFVSLLGEMIFERIPPDELIEFVPVNNVDVVPYGTDILFIFNSLGQTSDGVFFSRRRPKIALNGTTPVIGFRRHAIDEICKRISPKWMTYLGLGDCFGRIANCLHFELVPPIAAGVDGPAPYAFTFYDTCPKGWWARNFVQEILGPTEDRACEEYYYRLGYCPADIQNGFLVARTILYPGFDKTPEAEAVRSSDLDEKSKNLMLFEARNLNTTKLQQSGNFATLKWFHEHGIPQVVRLKGEIYRNWLFD